MRLWDVKSGKEVYSFATMGSAVFSPNGKYILAAGEPFDSPMQVERRVSQGVSLWDVSTRNRIRVLGGEDVGEIESVSFSPDAQRALFVLNPVLVGSGGYTFGTTAIRLCDVASGRKVFDFEGQSADVSEVSFSNDERVIRSGNALWQATTGQQLRLIDQSDKTLKDWKILSTSADGRFALTNAMPPNEDEETPADIRLWLSRVHEAGVSWAQAPCPLIT